LRRDSWPVTGYAASPERTPAPGDEPQPFFHLHSDGAALPVERKDAGSLTVARFADQAHGEVPIGSIEGEVNRAAPKILLTTDTGRERFVVATSAGGADFSTRVLQRVSGGWRGSELQKKSAAPPGLNLTQLYSAGTAHAGSRFLSPALWITGTRPGSFLARFAADRLGPASFLAAGGNLYPESPSAQASILRQEGSLTEGGQIPTFLMSQSGGAFHRAASNEGPIINRSPSSFSAAGLPQRLARSGEPQSGSALVGHVASGQHPIHPVVQRQASGAPPAVGNQSGFQPTPPTFPAPAPLPQSVGRPDVTQLAEQVYRLIVARIASERDRRGL
jgi:hypothetical protein